PVFACELVERDLGHGRPFLPGRGAGCHPCRAIALQRALTAAAEMRLTTVAGVHDDPRLVRSRRSLESGSWRSALARVLGMGERSFASVPNTQHDSFDDDVPWLLARLASVGLEQVLAVDLTQTELELAVVRVIVPGLEALHDGVPALPGRRLASMTERSP
ncbi:MAG: YcaO-like family protein, partial [Myxococcales bacterium]|nr:YcaO-like family protein [Myxococcales bacterium]